MAYNGFPATYQPMFYQPQYQPQFQQQAPTQPAPAQQNIIWVQGEAAARGYLMAPNTTLPLWDSESNTIFLKTTDAAGMPSMKVLDYTIRDTAPANAPVAASPSQCNNSPAYATKADVDALTARIDALSAEVNGKKGASLNE
jgi:hypothetical protein